MKIKPLSNNERLNGGFTHVIEVTYADLTETVADTAQTLALLSLAAGEAVLKVAYKLVTGFADASDAAFNSTTIEIGDGTDVDWNLQSTQINEAGTEIDYSVGTGNTRVYLDADTLDMKVTSMAAKALNDLDSGEIHVYVQVANILTA